MKQWHLKALNPEGQKKLSQALNISWITAQVLSNRGLENLQAAESFLNPKLKDLPNPFLLPDMDKACRRIIQAIAKKEAIAIYGDYDVDGITASALLVLFFKELGVAVRAHIPDRIKEGYGLQKQILEKLKNEGVGLVITADCGTKSHEALQQALEMELDVIVTDHHETDSQPSAAHALINPKRGGQKIGEELAGCGVAFFLIMALRQKLREENFFTNGEPNLKQYLDLVALATIGDLAPVTGINRILVSLGLKELAQTKRPGLIALKEVAGLKPTTPLTSADIGFRLGPRINAGGRIAKASLGLDLLCALDLGKALGLAKILDQCNQDRQAMQEKHLKEAFEQVGPKEKNRGLVVHSKDWHPGIVGLVASKLTQNFYRPSIAFSIEGELARGSARSIPGIHIVEILEGCSEFLEQFGGHAQAAGLTLKQENLKKFEELFEKALQQYTTEETLTPKLEIDCEIKLSDIDGKLVKELELLRPFGIHNPQPLFVARNVQLNDFRIVGKNHLKFMAVNGDAQFEAIGFDLGKRFPLSGGQGDIAFSPEWNTYEGKTKIQLKIKDLKIN